MKKLNFKDIRQLTGEGRYGVTHQMNHIGQTIERWQQYGLDLDPDFQRGHVWTEDQQSAFIEFLLRGGKMSPILFNHPNWMTTFEGTMQIVDGKQRLTAILKFLNDEVTVFYGFKLSEIENLHLSTIDIPVRINDLKTREEVLLWYLELNSGGTPHSESEIERVKQLLVKEL